MHKYLLSHVVTTGIFSSSPCVPNHRNSLSGVNPFLSHLTLGQMRNHWLGSTQFSHRLHKVFWVLSFPLISHTVKLILIRKQDETHQIKMCF